MRVTGTVKFYSFRKGYGFFLRDDGERDVFIHASELRRANIEPFDKSARYAFQVVSGQKGPKAINVTQVPAVVDR